VSLIRVEVIITSTGIAIYSTAATDRQMFLRPVLLVTVRDD